MRLSKKQQTKSKMVSQRGPNYRCERINIFITFGREQMEFFQVVREKVLNPKLFSTILHPVVLYECVPSQLHYEQTALLSKMDVHCSILG
jgi:hypothetical protein